MRFRRKPAEPEVEYQRALPLEFLCPYCGHKINQHGGICMIGGCSCRCDNDELRKLADRWVVEENRRRVKEARKIVSDLREWSA